MENFQSYLQNLNEQQKKAVETIQGPVLVVAGPGTGKTQMLAVRIASILKQTDTNPSNMLCLTFTDSGVVSMRNRLIKIIGKDAYMVHIHTFHSFCNEIIRRFPDKFVFARELVQLDDLGRLKIIKEIIDEIPHDPDSKLIPFYNKYHHQNTIISAIQSLKREGILAEKLQTLSENKIKLLNENPDINPNTGKPKRKWLTQMSNAEKNLELSKIYGSYNHKLEKSGYYDYEDMILFVIKKFEEDDELLAYYQEKYLYILVDEYQDTNGSQNLVIKALGSFDRSPNIFAVGDDDQAIYRFQGANVENLLFFRKQFEHVKTIPVTLNYRSSQIILNAAQSLVEKNQNRLVNIIPNLEKNLKAAISAAENKIRVYEFTSHDTENTFLVKKVTELINGGVNPADIAVFYRKHSDAADLVEYMIKSGIPLRLEVGHNVLDQTIIKQFIKLLKVADFTDSDMDFLLFEILFYDFLGMDRVDVFKITRLASDKNINLFDSLSDETWLSGAKVKEPEKLMEFTENIIKWKSDSKNHSLIRFIESLAYESNYISHVFSRENLDIDKIKSVNSFFNYVRDRNKINPDLTLSEFLHDMFILEENNIKIQEIETETDKEAVSLMTAHKSKGMEFKHVFLIKCFDGNWGGRKKREFFKFPDELFDLTGDRILGTGDTGHEIDNDLEDERRLFFVALTRAKENLYISYSKSYPSGNTTKKTAPSRFLAEIDKQFLEFPDTVKYETFDIQVKKALLTPFQNKNYAEGEEEFLKSIIKNFKLSASSLNEYIECPLKFKFNKLLKVPRAKNKSLSMGTAIHRALEGFMRNLKKGEKKDEGYLRHVYEEALRKELMNSEDYLQTLEEGKKLLSNYYNNYKETFSPPAEVEYGFYNQQVYLEKQGIEPILLSGKIDKIEWLNRGENTVKVIDYKTSTPKSANEIKGMTKYSKGTIWNQIVFYRLLGDLDRNFRPSLTSPNYKIKQAEIDFIKPNSSGIFKKEIFEISPEDVDELKEKIFDVMLNIRSLQFDGTERYPLCGECDYCTL